MKPLRIAVASLPMTTTFRRASRVVASCLLLSGKLLAQPAVTMGWTGDLGGDSGKHSPVRFTVREDPAEAEFTIISPPSDTTRVSNVRFDGPIVHFRAAFKTPAVCALRAAPPRGYTGLCDAGEGSTFTLSMVPPVPGLLLPAHEMALAREAAPAQLAEHASVFVLEASGYHEVSGDDGYACYIWRPRTVDLWPICQLRDVTDALLPVERLRSRLRANGKVSEAAIEDSIVHGYSSGVFRLLAREALATCSPLTHGRWARNHPIRRSCRHTCTSIRQASRMHPSASTQRCMQGCASSAKGSPMRR
jgi:hypothetical protein